MPEGFDVLKWARMVEYDSAIERYRVNIYEPNDLRIKV
jgi:hypothetical protein